MVTELRLLTSVGCDVVCPREGRRASVTDRAGRPGRRAKRAQFLLDLCGHIVALGSRPRKTLLGPMIVAVLRRRGWTTRAEHGGILDMEAASVTKRHPTRMVGDGVLERRHPRAGTRPAQAYRSKPDHGLNARFHLI